ncbi:hypothetical protein ACIQGZ_04920 [Streptomyces sp. NPDC092296]|uniref:hypothetical protein n=1 Tax=Streptomyces sp. NPDC092296 TaxID=3366012 RepID=UPI00382C03FE
MMNPQQRPIPAVNGGDPRKGKVYVERKDRASGAVTTNLGATSLGASGWTSIDGANVSTWSGMYHTPTTKQVRACVSVSGGTACTRWY